MKKIRMPKTLYLKAKKEHELMTAADYKEMQVEMYRVCLPNETKYSVFLFKNGKIIKSYENGELATAVCLHSDYRKEMGLPIGYIPEDY